MAYVTNSLFLVQYFHNYWEQNGLVFNTIISSSYIVRESLLMDCYRFMSVLGVVVKENVAVQWDILLRS